eukprot:9479606-Pyramimonas_sp.AAC.1
MVLQGGIRQKLGATFSRPPLQRERPDRDAVHELVAKKFKAGALSAPDAQEFLNANAGSSSSSARPERTQHSHRDLVRQLNKYSTMPPVYEFDIDIWDAETSTKYTDTAHMLLPYEVFDCVADSASDWQNIPHDNPLYRDRQSWGSRLSPSVENCDNFAPTTVWGDSAPF